MKRELSNALSCPICGKELKKRGHAPHFRMHVREGRMSMERVYSPSTKRTWTLFCFEDSRMPLTLGDMI